MPQQSQPRVLPEASAGPRRLEGREWWLWGYAIAVTLVLTVGIISLTISNLHWSKDDLYFRSLADWVRALAALVLLFDLYTVYQHLQLQRIRRRLAEKEKLFQLITENAADMIAVVDMQGRRLYNSPAYERLLGYESGELAATSALEQVHPDDRSRVIEAAEKTRRTGRGERLEYRFRHRDGTWRILESTSSAIPDGADGIQGLVIVNRDITERKRAEALLEHQAFHDKLSGLPNRALLLDRLERAIAISRRHGDFKFAVLFIDIDDFRVVNDSMGHSAGDQLLMQIAKRLASCLRTADTVSRSQAIAREEPILCDGTLARPGGDEFIVLAEELRDPSDAIRMSERIQQRLGTPFHVQGQELVISASIGVAFGRNTGALASDVLRDAEIAMSRAKRAGKARYEIFDTVMHADAVKRLQLEAQLRKGLELGEFRVYYQPLVSLVSRQIVGFEALTRWQRPEGIVMPGEFIRVADEIGVTLSINCQLLHEACEQILRWQALHSPASGLSISANITAKQFAQADLAERLGEIISQTGIDPDCVDLEITETIAMADAEHSVAVLSRLKALGVRLSIDDFGTGYSSLSRLQRFPVDTLKIDRTFVANIDCQPETHEIVRIIVMLAHSLGLQVVAEGIERQEQEVALKNLGCELGQGYLFSKPVDAASVPQLWAADQVRGQRKSKAAAGHFS